MTDKADEGSVKTGTELEQDRRKLRLAAELRANLKRRKTGHAAAKAPAPGRDDQDPR